MSRPPRANTGASFHGTHRADALDCKEFDFGTANLFAVIAVARDFKALATCEVLLPRTSAQHSKTAAFAKP